jgi:hypothetical protein
MGSSDASYSMCLAVENARMTLKEVVVVVLLVEMVQRL